MPRRGDNIHKRKDGRWEGRYKDGLTSDGSAKYRSVYAHSFTECKTKLDNIRLLSPSCYTQSCNMRYSELLYRWLSTNKIRLKESTVLKYLNIIETHLIPDLGNFRISKVDSFTVNNWLESKISNSEHPFAASYVRTMAIIVEASLRYAAGEGLCPALRTPINKPALSVQDPPSLSGEINRKMVEIIAREKSYVALGMLLALQAGLRIGEICALRWDDVDLKSGTIHIRHTVIRRAATSGDSKTELALSSPKTATSRRDIPLSPLLKKMLSERMETDKSIFVVTGKDKFMPPRTFDYQYHRLLDKYNLPSINFHALRHTFATECAQAGMDAKSLSRLLGHSSVSTTLNVYVHPSMEIISQQINQLFPSL